MVSIGAMVIAFLGLILNTRKETRTDAAESAKIQTKLDNLITGVTDIRVEIRAMQGTIGDHSERLAKVESRAESNTHRLDALEVDGNRATGSILTDFNSLQKSVLDGRTEDRSTQKAFVLNDENDNFQSTVPDDKAKQSAGTFHTWQDDKDNPQQQL